MFPRNVGLSSKYTALQPRRLYSLFNFKLNIRFTSKSTVCWPISATYGINCSHVVIHTYCSRTIGFKHVAESDECFI
jgi:hypothetical protein